jgi:hypothetical protein
LLNAASDAYKTPETVALPIDEGPISADEPKPLPAPEKTRSLRADRAMAERLPGRPL